MKFIDAFWRAVLIFVAGCVIQIVAGILVPMKAIAKPHLMEWLLLANAITVGALAVVAVRTEWRGWRLGVAVAAIPLAITSVNMLEGTVFLTNTDLQWGRIFVYTLVSACLIVPVWTLAFGRGDGAPVEHFHPIESKSRVERAWKFVVCDFAYFFLYFTAGTIVFPFVKDFYATQHLPPMTTLLALQLLVRGPVFVVLCLALVRMLGMPRLTGALVVGAVFTIVSGVAPLLLPNPVFPDAVRWAHMCEVTSSNFVFGVIVALLWGRPGMAEPQALRRAA